MSKAFKCDICGDLIEGFPVTVHVTPKTITSMIDTIEICEDCGYELSNAMMKRCGINQRDKIVTVAKKLAGDL